MALRQRQSFGQTPVAARMMQGNLAFPKLKDRKPTRLSTLDDLKHTNVTVSRKRRIAREKTVSKSHQRIEWLTGGSIEWKRIRYNLSYKPILDLIGTDFPVHPEFFYVADIICDYYNVPFDEAQNFLSMWSGQSYTPPDGIKQMHTKAFNLHVKMCTSALIYFFYIQYSFNPMALADIFDVEVDTIQVAAHYFARSFDTSEAVRADYSMLHGKLIELEVKG